MHASLADILADLTQNSVEAGAGRITVSFSEKSDEIRFSVLDDGKGMDEGTLAKALDPFWSDGIKHPGRRVGLGIPFLRQTADQCGGRVEITSTPGKGTRVEAIFPADNVDLPPVGNLVLLWVQCLSFDGSYGMEIHRRREFDGREDTYRIDRDQMIEALGGLEDVGALGLLKEYIVSLEESLNEEQREGEK
jgi:anti-sigma regulatory factor (Ser/Thr protein kinase)